MIEEFNAEEFVSSLSAYELKMLLDLLTSDEYMRMIEDWESWDYYSDEDEW